MPGVIVKIDVDGSLTEIPIKYKGSVKWEDLHRNLNDGYIERVKVRYQGRVRDAYVDEEGLLKGLQRNLVAEQLVADYYGAPLSQWLVGPIVIWVPNVQTTLSP